MDVNLSDAYFNDNQNHSLNSTTMTITTARYLRFSLNITIIIYIIYLIPFCFGVFGNISVCLIFFRQKELRSITNIFLMNLCNVLLSLSLSK